MKNTLTYVQCNNATQFSGLSEHLDSIDFPPNLQAIVCRLERQSEKTCSEIWHDAHSSCAEYTGIYNGKILKPKKDTILAIGIALQACNEDFVALCRAGGYAFPIDVKDGIVQYYALNNLYIRNKKKFNCDDLDQINRILAEKGIAPLGSKITSKRSKEANTAYHTNAN